jgi:hypothetical protein
MRLLSHHPNQKLIAGAYKKAGRVSGLNNVKRLAFCEPFVRVGWRFCFVRRVGGQIFYLSFRWNNGLRGSRCYRSFLFLSTNFTQR